MDLPRPMFWLRQGAVVYAVSRSGRPKLEGETSHENVIHLAADVSDYKEMGN